jgi:hypothetical protein
MDMHDINYGYPKAFSTMLIPGGMCSLVDNQTRLQRLEVNNSEGVSVHPHIYIPHNRVILSYYIGVKVIFFIQLFRCTSYFIAIFEKPGVYFDLKLIFSRAQHQFIWHTHLPPANNTSPYDYA